MAKKKPVQPKPQATETKKAQIRKQRFIDDGESLLAALKRERRA